MIILNEASSTDITAVGRDLLSANRDRKMTFEEAAQIVVNTIYDEFRQSNGDPLFALVRIFRFGEGKDLSNELKARAATDSRFWLSLMGTTGIEANWRDRKLSQGHRVIPADSAVTPMLQQAFSQIGLAFGEQVSAGGLQIHSAGTPTAGYFFVPEALGSQYIPAQDDFVKPYGIQSVIGIGSTLLNNSSCMCICFSTAPISAADAEKFAAITPYVATLLSIFNKPETLWI